MAMFSDAAMVIFCDVEGDEAEHDDWHTHEHLHERLSIPGFLRGTRWVARSGTPKYLIVYEVADLGVARSDAYLARLNNPTPWTRSIMARLRGMIRGFCSVAASSGYGLGTAAFAMRFMPAPGKESQVRERLARDVLPAMASRRGMASVHLLQPAARPPMTVEQSMRGKDADMTWVLLATAYDEQALKRAAQDHLDASALERYGISPSVERGTYGMHHTVTAAEVGRTAPHAALGPGERVLEGVRPV